MYQPKIIDPRCNLVFDYDVKSRLFQAAQPVYGAKPINQVWGCDAFLDQGKEGACAAFAASHALYAEPIHTSTNNQFAFDLYEIAKRHDSIPGEDYSGTTLLGVAKALMKELKLISGFTWCFGLRDLIMTVGYRGPVIVGTNWYEDMSKPSIDGLVKPTGQLVGGHGYMIQGINVDYQYAIIHNSWGIDKWGKGGIGYILFKDLKILLSQGGQVMFLEELPPAGN